MNAPLSTLLAGLALLAVSAEAKGKPRDAILLSQVSCPGPASLLCYTHTHVGQTAHFHHDQLLTPPLQVESLTLRADRETTHRRAPAVPQLKCVSSRAICSKYKIDTMRCENKGSGYDSEDIQWSCSASLPTELKLGSTDVVRATSNLLGAQAPIGKPTP